MNKWNKLKSVGVIAEILGKEGLRDLGFDIPRGKVMARQAIMLNRMEEELPSMSDIAKVDNIELQEITENTVRSMKDLIAQFEWQETLPMCELQCLIEQLRSIRGLLKVEVAKKVQLEERIEREKRKLAEIRDNLRQSRI